MFGVGRKISDNDGVGFADARLMFEASARTILPTNKAEIGDDMASRI
jgi:hypothetical protein